MSAPRTRRSPTGGETTTLFPFLYNPDGQTTGWALLCFDGRSSEARAVLLDAIWAVASWKSVRPRLVLAGPLCAGGDVPVLSDLDGKAHGAYGLEGKTTLVLIRPDGHIAFRGPAGRPELLKMYCERVFGTPVPEAVGPWGREAGVGRGRAGAWRPTTRLGSSHWFCCY